MMKVTKTTFGMLHQNKKDTVLVQRMTNTGKWGKPYEAKRYGNETDDQVIARLISLNNREFKLAQ